MAQGTATITAKAGTNSNFTATCAVTVNAAGPTITLEKSSLTLYPSGSYGSVTVTVQQGGSPVTNAAVSLGTPTGTTAVTATIRTPSAGAGTGSSSAYTDAKGQVVIDVTPGTTTGTVTIPVSYTGATTQTLTVNVTNGKVSLVNQSNTPPIGSTVSLDNWDNYNSGLYYRNFAVSPQITGLSSTEIANQYDISYAWYLGDANYPQRNPVSSNSTYNTYTLYSNNEYLYYYNGYTNNRLTCVATFYNKNTNTVYTTASAYWTINTGYTGNVLASATVYYSGGYSLGDVDDAGRSSIVSQLDSYFYSTSSGRYGVAYVRFGSTTSGSYGTLNASTSYNYYTDRYTAGTYYSSLADVVFTPGTSKGTASFPITVYYYTSSTNQSSAYISSVSGTITFNVTEGTSTGDIAYTGELGDDVPFTLKDFEDFYYNKTRGSLSYVSFTLPSGGTLYADGGRLNSSNACYASPSRTQTDLAGVYFSPTGTTATRPSTVRISFTAYGNRSSVGGTVAITYLSGTAKDITYNAASTSGVSLKASDFTDAYRQAVGSTAPSGLTIQFQDVPTYGTLTYKDSSRTNASEVTLRSSNIKNYKFTTRSSGSNQLSDVTYTPSGSRTDTISYIAYNGNTPQFTGKVVFNATMVAANMSVTFTGGQTITLNYNEFVKVNAVAMASAATLRIMSAPVSGTLSYAGTAVTPGVTALAPTAVGSLTYRANSGFNGTDKVIFSCVDASGNTVATGQINLIVSGNTTGGGVSNISQFTDVPSNAWYASDLNTLISRGIMQGKGAGKFDPKGELKYGEALKIFLLSAGYSAQEGTGKNWAQGYKTLAVSNGWISSDVDLDARISRNAMAELAAKVLGISSSSTVPPAWTDGTSNGYANALYYTNPQILVGNADGTFKGNDTLQRQEICKIASRVLNYKSNAQSNEKPGWIG